MGSHDHQLSRLLTAARRASNDLRAEVPMGFCTRVLAETREARAGEFRPFSFVMRGLMVASIVTLLSVATGYSGIRDFIEAKSTTSVGASYADSAISLAITR